MFLERWTGFVKENAVLKCFSCVCVDVTLKNVSNLKDSFAVLKVKVFKMTQITYTACPKKSCHFDLKFIVEFMVRDSQVIPSMDFEYVQAYSRTIMPRFIGL